MSAAPAEVVVVGNVGIDTNVYLPGEDVDWSRETNFTDDRDYVGQAGGYSSRGYAQLGYRTAFIGTVGEDFSGRFVREEFARDGIDMRGMFVDPQGTARSVNIMYRDGRRKNFYDAKGHMALQPDLARCREVLAGAKLAHVHLPHWARHVLPMMREAGVRIAVDLQDVVSAEDPYRKDFVAHADFLFFSAANHGSPEPLMRAFLSARPDLVVIAGMGAQGCALGTRDGLRFFPPVEMETPVVDTNGAGDGLAVGFLSSHVLERRSLEDSIRRGQLAARYTCGLKASSSNLITRAQLGAYERASR